MLSQQKNCRTQFIFDQSINVLTLTSPIPERGKLLYYHTPCGQSRRFFECLSAFIKPFWRLTKLCENKKLKIYANIYFISLFRDAWDGKD